MTAPSPAGRSPAASAAALIGVILLFGAVTFVAGLNVAGIAGQDGASPQPTAVVPSDVATPERWTTSVTKT